MIHCLKDEKGYYTLQIDQENIPTKIIYTLEENGIYNVEIHCPFWDQENDCFTNGIINYKTKTLPISAKLIQEFKEHEKDTLFTITIENGSEKK